MVEIYLFVNPLGGVCLEIEKEIIQLSVNDKKKIQLRFIPLLNMKTINEFLSRQHIPINDMYRKDRQSDFVKESFQTDQKVAREMGIKQHPTAVVYNYTCENDFGILVENFENMDEIKQLCRVHPHNELLLDQGDATFEFKRRSNYHFPNGHLHLL